MQNIELEFRGEHVNRVGVGQESIHLCDTRLAGARLTFLAQSLESKISRRHNFRNVSV